MSHPSLRLLLLASTILAVPTFTPAVAQDADPAWLGEIRIEGAGAQSLLGNAEITEEEIEDRNAVTMKDVFAGESAITSSGGAPIAQKVYVNGIEESLLSVTIDGARQNKSAFHHTGNVLIDPTLLKSVKVTSGLAPADAGAGAMAGSIAYETKDARDLLDAGDTFGGMVTLGTGTNGQDLRGALTVFGQSGGFEYLLNASGQKGSDYKDGSGTTIPGTEPSLTNYLAKVAYTTDSGHRLAFSASQTKDDGKRVGQFHGFYGVYFLRPDFTNTFGRGTGAPGPFKLLEGLSERNSYTLTYTDETPEGWFAPTVQLTYNEQKMDVVGVWGVNKSLSGVASNEFELANGTVNVGVDFFDESAAGHSRSASVPAGTSVGPTGTEYHKGIGVFAQARQDLTDRVSVSYGARYDAQEFTGADGSNFSDDGLSVNASLDFALTDTLSFTAGAASTWGGYELGEAALINLSGPWAYSGMKTSRAKNARVGLRYDDGTWNVSGALFSTSVNDLSTVLPGFPTNNRAATTDIKTKGIDASVGYTGDNGFVRLNYTYADVTENGDTIGGTRFYYGRPMGHIFGLEAAWQANEALRLGGTAQMALDVKLADDSTFDGYKTVNVFAEYVPPQMDNLTVRLDVKNLFDETYVARGADYMPGRTVPLTEPGRTILLTATARF